MSSEAIKSVETPGPVAGIVAIQDEVILVTDTELQFVNTLGLKNSVPNEPTNCFCVNKDKILLAHDLEILQLHKQGDMDKYLVKEEFAIRTMDCFQDVLVYGFGNTLKRFDMLKDESSFIELSNIPMSCKYSPDGKFIAVADNAGTVSIYKSDSLESVEEFPTYLKYNIDLNDKFPFVWTPLNGLLIKGVGNLYYLDHRFKKVADIDFMSIIRDLYLHDNTIFICTSSNISLLDFKTHQITQQIDVDAPIGMAMVNDQLFVAKQGGGCDIVSEFNKQPAIPNQFIEQQAIEDPTPMEPDTQTDINYQKIFNDDDPEDAGDDLNDFLEEDEQELHVSTGQISNKQIKQALMDLSNQQEPFQSGSTPYVGTKRFLAYNLVGKVSKIKRDDGAFIQGIYHNKSKQVLKYSDLNNYEMADISEDGLYMVRNEEPYELAYHDPDRQNDWHVSINNQPLAMAAFKGGVALYTSNHKVYIFDFAGVVVFIFTVEGTCISLSAFENKIFVVYSDMLGNMCYSYVDSDGCKLIKQGQLPINHKILNFASFSYSGNPVVYDESGSLQMLSRGNLWVPILDLSKQPIFLEYHLWPIGVSTERFHFVACPKEMPYPPIPDAIPTSVLLEMKGYGTNENHLSNENELLTLHMIIKEFENDNNEDQVYEVKTRSDKIALKLIQDACKESNFKKVVALANRLHLQGSYEGAAKIVNYFNRSDIADMILEAQNDGEFDANDQVQQFKQRDPFAYDDMLVEEIPTQDQYSMDPLNKESMHPLPVDVSSMIKQDMTIQDTMTNPFAVDKPVDAVDTTFTEAIEEIKEIEEKNERNLKRMMADEQDRKRVKINTVEKEKENEQTQTQLNF